MNVDYNDAGKAAEPTATALPSPEEQAINASNGDGESAPSADEGSRRRPGCEGYVHVNESDAW